MGYKIVMECVQTQVGDHDQIGYRSGEQLPVGHKDVGPDWKPVIVEVADEKKTEDKPAADDKSAEKSVQHGSKPQTGVKQ